MENQAHNKKQYQGITTLFQGTEFKKILHEYPPITRWVMSEENLDTNYHIHFVIEGDKLALSAFRAYLKDYLKENNRAPQDYTNGKLNLAAIKLDKEGKSTIDTMIIYILKQGYYTAHNYDTEYIKQLAKLSYIPKKITMTKSISVLKEEYINLKITLEEYTFKYRKIRNEYRKPDPNWHKELDRMREIKKSDEQIKEEILNYINYSV